MLNRFQALRFTLFCGCAAAALTGLGANAFAAEATASTNSLEEVVVTAQRRSERLVDVPMSVVALSGDQVAKAGVQSIHDIGNITAGVQVNFAGCCTQPAIRGISTLTTGIGFENNVAVYVDGFYTPDNTSVNSDLSNIGSIEVLKGPQGTLWGRNATGGAILINTLAPSATFTGKLQAGYARYDEVMATAYFSGPINDRVRYSIAAYGRRSHGYNKRLDQTGKQIGWASPLRQASVRAKFDVDLTENLVGTLGLNYGHSSDPRGNVFTIQQYPSAALPKPPARADQPYTGSSNRDPMAQLLAITQEGTLKLVYTTPIGKLTSYTGIAVRRHKQALDFDSSYSDFTYSAAFWRQTTFQQGLDYNITAVDGLDLVVGGNYYTDRYKELRGYTYASNALVSNTTMTLKAEAVAGYVDATYHLTDTLSINGGARYTHEKKEGAQRTVSPATGALIGQAAQNSVTFKAFTPRASIRYELAPDTNVYATIARGFRSGGFPPFSVASAAAYTSFKPEKITSYEVGFKASRSRYRFDAAAFYYDYTNLQVGVTIPNPLVPSTTVQTVLNAPKAEVYGVDADFMAQPVERLNVHVGAAWLHGRYTKFPQATGTGLNPVTLTNIVNQAQDWTGQQMTRAPSFSGNLGVDYTFENVAGGSLLVGGNVKYTASYVIHAASLYGPTAGALANKQRYRQGAYTLVNVQATWTDPSEHYKVMVYINNLTDKRYRITYNGGTFGDYSSWGQPLTWGVKVGYDF